MFWKPKKSMWLSMVSENLVIRGYRLKVFSDSQAFIRALSKWRSVSYKSNHICENDSIICSEKYEIKHYFCQVQAKYGQWPK